jgi:hypothetical protein
MTKNTEQDKLIDQLIAGYDGPESFWGNRGYSHSSNVRQQKL